MTDHTPIAFNGETHTYEGLYNLSGPEQVKLYNAIAAQVGMEKTKRFGDKTSAVKRIWAALSALSNEGATIATAPSELAKSITIEQLGETETGKANAASWKKENGGPVKAVKPAKEPKAPKVKKEAAARKPRGKRFVFPKGDKLKPPKREGTYRHTLVKLLTREQGATFKQCMAATWGTDTDMTPEIQEKTTYEAMRLLHYYNGYGSRHLNDGSDGREIHIQIYF